MRKKLLNTGLLILLMITLLTPLAFHMTAGQQSAQLSDAEHVVGPMVRLYGHNAAVCADTPVAPVVDIEEIWAIEDERQEAENALVIGMRHDDGVLGYDAQSQTFYCTIGLDFPEDAWPELRLFAQSADPDVPIDVLFVDDYTYDFPADAVAEGYRYELLAYSEKEYQYFGIVFTGLPIVALHAEDVIGDEYIPACVNISSTQNEAITSMAKVHLRGGGYGKPIDKLSYRFELHQLGHDGRNKRLNASILGMEPDSDWLLIGSAQDSTAIYNYLAFDMWNRWKSDQPMFMQLENHMVELFVQDEYMGLYQLMQRVDPEREILNAGGNLSTDAAVRIIALENFSDRPIMDISPEALSKVEYLYAPGNNERIAFSAMENYVKMFEWTGSKLSDKEFIKAVEEQVDIENFMTYFLFQQSVGLMYDNVRNNVYIFMLNENGKMMYHLAPWDMDCAFFYGFFQGDATSDYRFNMDMTPAVRMLDLNVGNCREILHRIYKEKRKTILSEEAIKEWVLNVENMISASCAYQRETEKWYDSPSNLYLYDLMSFEIEQAALIGEQIEKRWPLEEVVDP